MTENDVTEYAARLNKWVDSLVLVGNSGRRAAFVERSLKRKYKTTISNAINMKKIHVPWNWEHGINKYKFITLWHITIEISKKFKTEIPEELGFMKLLFEI